MSGLAQGDVLHSNDSKSLWNYTLSPGWTEKEVEVFRIALMKFGIGRWTKIVESRCLPGKTVAQLNNQCQRMIGQQSTSAFTGLHIDPSKVFAHNAKKKGHRKNGSLINTDNNPTREMIEKKKVLNKERWGLSSDEINQLVIPVLDQKDTSTVVVKSTLMGLKDTSNARQEKYNRIRELQAQVVRLTKHLKLMDQGVINMSEEPEKAKPAPKTKKKTSKQKVAPKKKKTTSRKTSRKSPAKEEKTQEELDMELAMRLQQEEGGLEAMDTESDSDFERPTRKRKSKSKRRKISC